MAIEFKKDIGGRIFIAINGLGVGAILTIPIICLRVHGYTTIEETEQILSKMKELQGDNNGAR